MLGVWMFIVGFVVGLVARAILPGTQSIGIILTAVLGIAGSFIAGLAGQDLGWYPAGAGAGLLAGVLMTVIYYWAPDYDGEAFVLLEQPLGLPLVMGVLYGIGMHWGYYQRRFSQRPVLASLGRLGVICFLIRAVGVVVGLSFLGEVSWDSLGLVLMM